MQLQELTEQLMSAASLQEQEPPTQAQTGDASGGADATKPALPPGLAANAGKTTAEILADLNRSPLFMTEMEADNDDIAALQALDYEGTPLENASDFKDRGNERFGARGGLPDAREFYTRGVLLLTAEERKRAAAAAAAAAAGDPPRSSETEEEEVAAQRALLATLHVNRAACELGLENHRAAWLDCVAALRLDPRAVKAYYRAARALLRVDRVAEAADMCARGLAFDPANAALGALAGDVAARAAQLDARRRREREREEAARRRERLLRAALAARGIRVRETARPPETEDARVRLVPDAEDPRSRLAFPVLLLYPERGESDLVKAFEETQSLADHLAYVLPPPWDAAGAYRSPEAVSCYVETADGGLLRMGKKASLLKVLSTGRVEVVDQLLRVFVLPTDKADGWIVKFKEQKAKEMGRS